MAVFLINICKFNGCEKIFPSLNDLIHHIEDTHIDYDSPAPGFSEKTHSTCLPLSYVLRFISDRSRNGGAVAPAATATNGTDKSKPALTAATIAAGGAVSSINQTSGLVHAAATASGPNGGNGPGCALSSPTGGGGGGGGGGLNSSSSCSSSNSSSSSNLSSCSSSSEHNGHGSSLGSPSDPAKGHLNQSTGGGGGGGGGTTDLKRKIAIKHHSYSLSVANRSTTPTGSEMDDDEMMVSESEDSNDSWTTEEFSSEFIMRYGSRRHSSSGGGNGINSTNEKPFACPVPGCKKRYKNVNGIKYHSKNGHKKDGNRVRKAFKCYCGKSYKTSQRLKNHNMVTHAATTAGGTGVQNDGATLAAVPLASPALPSASSALLVTPVKSPSLNSSTGGSSSNTSMNSTIAGSPSTTSSQIGTNVSGSSSSATVASIATTPTTPTIASPSSTSPATPHMVQAPAHKVPRTLVLTSSPVSGSGNGGGISSITSAATTTSTTVASVTPSTPTTGTTVSTTTTATKYDNLGILTPATSPKLIAASLCPDGAGKTNQHQVVSSSTNATSAIGGAGAAVGGGGGGGGGGENVGIALLVSSSSVGNETKLLNGAAAGSNKSTVLSASVSAGQLFAEET